MQRVLILFSIFNIYLTDVKAQTWDSVPGRIPGGVVFTLYTDSDYMYVGGVFDMAGMVTVNNIGKFNGTTWSNLWFGITGGDKRVFCMESYNAELYLGGRFTEAGFANNTNRIARWDGVGWKTVGGGIIGNTEVSTLKSYKGELYAGGGFSWIGGDTVNCCIARWNGSQWNPVTPQGSDGSLQSMAVYKDELYIGGFSMGNMGGLDVANIVRWNGSQWNKVGVGVGGLVSSMTVDTIHNDLFAGGGFFNAINGDTTFVSSRFVARWNGAEWSDVGGGSPTNGALALSMYHNKLYVGGGSMTGTEGDTVVAAWDGRSWERIGGPNSTVTSLIEFQDTLYVGGYFETVGGDSLNYIAKYYEPNLPTCLNYSSAIAKDADTVYLTTGASVQFSDSSNVILDSWFWDFGDNNSDTVQHPAHIFDSVGTFTIMMANTCGSYFDTIYTSVTVEEKVGVNKLSPVSTSMSIYPNPSKSGFTIQIDQKEAKEIKIYNIKGELVKLVSMLEHESRVVINTYGWVHGTYMSVLLINEQPTQSEQIVVQ